MSLFKFQERFDLTANDRGKNILAKKKLPFEEVRKSVAKILENKEFIDPTFTFTRHVQINIDKIEIKLSSTSLLFFPGDLSDDYF